MKITQIRNATQLITYAGKRFLIDPMLAKKGLNLV
jgi:L-ascorbate metabolism protein UlaG (beta-lactamase superfamily)